MKKFNTKLAAALVLSLTAVVTSCTGGNNGTQSIENPVEAYNGEAVTIKFYSTMGTNLVEKLTPAIERFNEIYPNITVEHTSVGSYDDVRDQIKTEISVGAQPNLAYCYPDHVALYNAAHAVRTLDDFINSEISQPTFEEDTTARTEAPMGFTQAQIADFISGYYEEGRQFGDNKMYTLPFSKSTEVLYYNKTFFDEHKLSVPTNWDEVETVARQIKAIEPNSIPLGYDSEANWFITLAEQYGNAYTQSAERVEDRFLFDNAGNKELMKKIGGWYKDGLVTTQKLYGSYTSGLFTNLTANDEGVLVRSLMCIGSSAGATHQRPTKGANGYPFEVGIAPVPQKDAAHGKVISQGPSITMFKSTPQQEAATWLLMKFLTTDISFQAEFSMASGYMPVLKSVETNEYYVNEFLSKADGGDYIAALSAKAAFEQKDSYYTSPAFIGSSVARDNVGELVVSVMSQASKPEGLTDASLNQIFADTIDECIYNTK